MLAFLKLVVGCWIGLVLALVVGVLVSGGAPSSAEFFKLVVVGFFGAIGLAIILARSEEADGRSGWRWSEIGAYWALIVAVFFAVPSAVCIMDGRTFDDPFPGRTAGNSNAWSSRPS